METHYIIALSLAAAGAWLATLRFAVDREIGSYKAVILEKDARIDSLKTQIDLTKEKESVTASKIDELSELVCKVTGLPARSGDFSHMAPDIVAKLKTLTWDIKTAHREARAALNEPRSLWIKVDTGKRSRKFEKSIEDEIPF